MRKKRANLRIERYTSPLPHTKAIEVLKGCSQLTSWIILSFLFLDYFLSNWIIDSRLKGKAQILPRSLMQLDASPSPSASCGRSNEVTTTAVSMAVQHLGIAVGRPVQIQLQGGQTVELEIVGGMGTTSVSRRSASASVEYNTTADSQEAAHHNSSGMAAPSPPAHSPSPNRQSDDDIATRFALHGDASKARVAVHSAVRYCTLCGGSYRIDTGTMPNFCTDCGSELIARRVGQPNGPVLEEMESLLRTEVAMLSKTLFDQSASAQRQKETSAAVEAFLRAEVQRLQAELQLERQKAKGTTPSSFHRAGDGEVDERTIFAENQVQQLSEENLTLLSALRDHQEALEAALTDRQVLLRVEDALQQENKRQHQALMDTIEKVELLHRELEASRNSQTSQEQAVAAVQVEAEEKLTLQVKRYDALQAETRHQQAQLQESVKKYEDLLAEVESLKELLRQAQADKDLVSKDAELKLEAEVRRYEVVLKEVRSDFELKIATLQKDLERAESQNSELQKTISQQRSSIASLKVDLDLLTQRVHASEKGWTKLRDGTVSQLSQLVHECRQDLQTGNSNRSAEFLAARR